MRMRRKSGGPSCVVVITMNPQPPKRPYHVSPIPFTSHRHLHRHRHNSRPLNPTNPAGKSTYCNRSLTASTNTQLTPQDPNIPYHYHLQIIIPKPQLPTTGSVPSFRYLSTTNPEATVPVFDLSQVEKPHVPIKHNIPTPQLGYTNHHCLIVTSPGSFPVHYQKHPLARCFQNS